MNLNMNSGQVVKDNMIMVIEHLNEAEINKAKIHKETQIDMILNSLIDTCIRSVQLDHDLNQKEYSLTSVVQMLHMAKKMLLKKKDEVNLMDIDVSHNKAKINP